jgi:predicted lipoprotein with Yx(FWY)xxD motif
MSAPTLRRRQSAVIVALAAVGVLAAACGGSSGGSSLKAAANGGGGGKGVVVETKHGSLGTYLTDGSGRTLYTFAADKGTTSNCSGSCSHYWPPLLTTSSAKAAGGAKQSMLGTTKRSDGKTQVTYGGHPVYYYVGDAKAGDTKGQGLNLSGGLWWVEGSNGSPITKSSSSSNSGYGNGYGG